MDYPMPTQQEWNKIVSLAKGHFTVLANDAPGVIKDALENRRDTDAPYRLVKVCIVSAMEAHLREMEKD